MEIGLLLEYGWVLLILIGLEGILAADNALVIATMVKHLPEDQRKKALFYGLAGAFVFRFGSLFIISYLVHIWQVQAIGALYLFGIALYHILKKHVLKKKLKDPAISNESKKGSGLGSRKLPFLEPFPTLVNIIHSCLKRFKQSTFTQFFILHLIIMKY